MAGILFLVAVKLIDWGNIRKIVRVDRTEAVVMMLTFIATLVFKLDFAILLGVLMSLMVYLRKTSKPRVTPRAPDPRSEHRKFSSDINLPECPQLKLLRIEGSLYFGSVTHVRELLRRYREHYRSQKRLLLLTKGINQVDISGAELLAEEARLRRAVGGDLYLYRLKESAGQVLNRGGYREVIGEENIYDNKGEAIHDIFQKLDKEICRTCTKRVFWECRDAPGPEPEAKSSGRAS